MRRVGARAGAFRGVGRLACGLLGAFRVEGRLACGLLGALRVEGRLACGLLGALRVEGRLACGLLGALRVEGRLACGLLGALRVEGRLACGLLGALRVEGRLACGLLGALRVEGRLACGLLGALRVEGRLACGLLGALRVVCWRVAPDRGLDGCVMRVDGRFGVARFVCVLRVEGRLACGLLGVARLVGALRVDGRAVLAGGRVVCCRVERPAAGARGALRGVRAAEGRPPVRVVVGLAAPFVVPRAGARTEGVALVVPPRVAARSVGLGARAGAAVRPALGRAFATRPVRDPMLLGATVEAGRLRAVEATVPRGDSL